MNWLTPLCQQIVADKRFTREQRDSGVLWAGELSGICDRWVMGAPSPIIDADPDYEGSALVLCWLWQKRVRSLSIYVEPDLNVSLMMLDGEFSTTEKPTHELLKRYVQCFFEGWEAPSVST